MRVRSMRSRALFALAGMSALLLSHRAQAQVLVEASTPQGNYFGLYSQLGVFASFSLSNTSTISTIDVFVRTPAATNWVQPAITHHRSVTRRGRVLPADLCSRICGNTDNGWRCERVELVERRVQHPRRNHHQLVLTQPVARISREQRDVDRVGTEYRPALDRRNLGTDGSCRRATPTSPHALRYR